MSEYHPAFDMPTTPEQAVAMLKAWGDPLNGTFNYRRAAVAAKLLGDALTKPTANQAMGAVAAELARAVRKFPTWPTDPLHAVAVLGEEFGELTKAVLQSVYEPHKVKPGEVRTEAVQTAAMALRFLQSLDAYAYTPGEQHAQESNEDAAIALMRGQNGLLARIQTHLAVGCIPITGYKSAHNRLAIEIDSALSYQPKDTADEQ